MISWHQNSIKWGMRTWEQQDGPSLTTGMKGGGRSCEVQKELWGDAGGLFFIFNNWTVSYSVCTLKDDPVEGMT